MKKNSYYRNLPGLFFLSCLTLFTLSCKKDQQTKLTQTDNVTIQEAKTWMQNNRPDIDLGKNWNNTKQINLENTNGILKVRINESLTNGTWALRDIMFQKDDQGKVDAVVYKLFVDTGYFTNKKGANAPSADKRDFINNNDFTGKMVLYTIQNQIIKIRQYENGIAIQELVHKASSKSNPYNPISYIKEDKVIMVCNNIGEECHPIGGTGGPLPGIPLPEFNITVPGTTFPPPIIFPPDTHTPPSTGPGVPIGNPGGGGGGGNTPNLNLPDLDVSQLGNYPEFKKLVTDLPNFLKKYPNIVKALSLTTGLSEAKIIELMQPGKGPKVVVVDNLVDENGIGLSGRFDKNNKILQIDGAYVRGLDAVNSPIRYSAIGLMLTVTTLHEFVHFGRDSNNLSDRYTVDSGGLYEAGWYFEDSIQPGDIGRLGPETAVDWLKYYKVRPKKV